MATSFVVLMTTFQQYSPSRKSMQISTQAVGFLPAVSTRGCYSKSIGHSKEGTRSGFIISIRSEHGRPYSHNCGKARRRKQHFQVREIPRLGFWYAKSSIRYILRKARAFYNELSCDSYEEPNVLGERVRGVGPYFSIPVIHPPNMLL